MLNAIVGDDAGSELIADDDVWPEEPTAVIPADQLASLRDVMDTDDQPTARFAPVREELLAFGSTTELLECAEVGAAPRAMEPSVAIAPAADRHRAWLIAVALVLLAVEVLALSW